MEKDLFKDNKEVAEIKPSATKKDLNKQIHVETTQELPSYMGRRVPKGEKLMVPESVFNAKLMKKI